MKNIRILLLSDFNISNLADMLKVGNKSLAYEPVIAPYNQVIETLSDFNNQIWKLNIDLAFIWTLPNNLLLSFKKILNGEEIEENQIFAEVDFFTSKIIESKNHCGNILVASWLNIFNNRSFNLQNYKGTAAISTALLKANLRLSANLEPFDNIFILDANFWLDSSIVRDEKLWYYSKTPFNFKVFKHAAEAILSATEGIYGQSKKLIITDLDNTLWGGIVGDDGWENIKIGGHDAIGEVFCDVQKLYKYWKNKGIILAIASKNDENNIIEVFNHRIDMPLHWHDFSCNRINWGDKARNVEEILNELNLPASSAIFIDDNESERARIQESFPEMKIFNFPKDVLNLYRQLQNLNCFNSLKTLKEDTNKASLYHQESERTKTKSNFNSIDSWLESLNIRILYENLNDSNIERAVQLFNKTSQMNLSTRRLTKTELLKWINENNAYFYCFSMVDKFGDAGLIGLISIITTDKYAIIKDFILSCRVFSRKVEESMLNIASKLAIENNCEYLKATYLPTNKNLPCLDFFKSSQFRADNNDYYYKLEKEYPIPDYININARNNEF